MNMALLHSHTGMFGLVLMLAAMACQAAAKFSRPRPAVVIFATLSLLMLVSSVLSVMYHRDTADGRLDDVRLSRAEVAMVIVTGVAAVTACGVIWQRVGFAAPFRRVAMFPYLAAALMLVTVMMCVFYAKGLHYWRRAEQQQQQQAAGDADSDDEVSRLYHLQWHLWSSFFAFLLVMMLFAVVRLYCNDEKL